MASLTSTRTAAPLAATTIAQYAFDPLQEGAAKIGAFWFAIAGICGAVGSAISLYAMAMHLKNYRRPDLQRMTLRIMLIMYYLVIFYLQCSKDLKPFRSAQNPRV
ncbi:hypothetical protein HK405_008540 [Cladochytrium tenue]|nr:hypothetical protein HK405_008540 [Cladochytrium tenue]